MDNKGTSDWWGKQGAIFASLAVLGTIVLLALGAAWVQDVTHERLAIVSAPEATCSGDQSECAKKDLPAQVRAARAGEALVDLAVWQLIVSAIALLGVVGLFWNIVQGRAALDRAAVANDISQRALDAEFRPWLNIEIDSFWIEIHRKFGHLVSGGNIRVRNFGTLPALESSFRWRVVPSQNGQAEDIEKDDAMVATPRYQNVVFPGSDGSIDTYTLSALSPDIDWDRGSFLLGLLNRSRLNFSQRLVTRPCRPFGLSERWSALVLLRALFPTFSKKASASS